METETMTKYQRAQKKVAEIKGFYNHLAVYIVVTVVLYFLRDKMTFILLSKRVFGSPELLERINWDVFGTPIVWGIALVFHALIVFGNNILFGKQWEAKKMRQFLDEAKNEKQWK